MPPLFNNPAFSRYFFAFSAWQISSWIATIAIPIMVLERYGLGSEVAISIGLRWLPTIFLGPFTGAFLDTLGPKRTVTVSVAVFSILLLLVPATAEFWQVQVLLLGMGVAGAVGSPAMLALRAFVVPDGQELLGNAVIQGVDRSAKLVGPLVAGVLLTSLGMTRELQFAALVGFFAAIFGQSLDIAWTKNKAEPGLGTVPSAFAAISSVRRFRESLLQDRIVLGLVVTGLGYMVTFGALKIYLIWLADLLGNPERTWSILLSAQGAGALVGALLGIRYLPKLETRFSHRSLYLAASCAEAIVLLVLAFPLNLPLSASVLILAGIPESFAFILYYAIIHRHIGRDRIGSYHSISLPLFDGALLLGIALAGYMVNLMPMSVVLIILVSPTLMTFLPFWTYFSDMRTDKEGYSGTSS